MTWINEGKFCFDSFLTDLKIPHCITTKNMGNLKDSNILDEFITLINEQKLFKNFNLNSNNLFLGEQKHTANFFEIIPNSLPLDLIKNNDGFYSKVSNVGMGVYTADCMPIFVVLPSKKISALLHSGWKGIELDITGKCIAEIKQKYSVCNSEIFIVIGPHLKTCCYEVGEEFKQKFEVEERFVKGEKKYFLDMQKNFLNKMIDIGLDKNNIKFSNFCTGCNNDLFYSYRFYNSTDKRMLSVLCNK
jgi:hypothetical protein